MAFDISQSAEIVQTMEEYIAFVRPEPDIRPQLDIGYELKGNSVFLFEIRPVWDNPQEIRRSPYAKTTFIKGKNIWKIYWMRANLKWYPYNPRPEVKTLKAFLKIFEEDAYGCFKG